MSERLNLWEEARDKHDGSLGKCLADVLGGEPLNAEELAWLDRLFGKAINSEFCPCGSGQKFSDCCKMIVRGLERQTAPKAEKKKLSEKLAEKKDDGVKWLVKIGIKDGIPQMEPANAEGDAPPTLEHVHDILETCVKSLHENLLMQRVHRMMIEVLRKSQGPKAGGIV